MYVGNLSWGVTDESLRIEFTALGFNGVQDSKVRAAHTPSLLSHRRAPPPSFFFKKRSPALTPLPP